MTQPSCARFFEVEALRDGRLTGAERSSFERHLATCTVCAREAEALDALGRALRTTPLVSPDELTIRRERTRLLAAFDRTLVGPRQLWLGRGALLAGVVALTLVVCGVMLWRVKAETGVVVASGVVASGPVIHANATARWSRQTRAGRELVVLEQGKLRVQTQQAPGKPAFRMMLPDGELEDIGTTFSVAVANGRTERVHVEEGSVLLKLSGRTTVVLRAGQTWQARPEDSPRPAPSSDVPLPSLEVPATRRAAPPLPSTSARASGATPLRTPGAAKAPADPYDAASEDFRAALAAFNARKLDDAALRFQRFSEQYSGDPRAEDAAYLRVLALERAGDTTGRRAAARAYLRRYKTGFRRAEVERLAR